MFLVVILFVSKL